MEAYTDAIASRQPKPGRQHLAVPARNRTRRILKPRVPAMRLPQSRSLRARCDGGPPSRALALLRRGGMAAVSLGGLFLGYLALQKIGIGHITHALISSEPDVCPARPGGDVLRRWSRARVLVARDPAGRAAASAGSDSVDAMQGTMIGVLMSSTLPARLGEPARALVVARRTGRPRGEPADRARHAGVADAVEPPRARDPGRRDGSRRSISSAVTRAR